MRTRAAVNEFAKMRHLRIVPLASALVVAVVGLTVFTAASNPAFADPAQRSWEFLLAGLSFAVPMCSPVLLAVLASRVVDIEHQGNGWLLSQTSGLTSGGLCRLKFVALGAVVAVATVSASALVLGIGVLLGISAPVPVALWLGYTVSALMVNLVVLALHILLSARVENQLVGLGLGGLGSLVAVFASDFPAWLAHATPWGHYALVAAADYRDGELVALTPSYPSVAVLGVVGGALFLLVTGLFDRQEA